MQILDNWKKPKEYFTSLWNWNDILSILGTLLIIVVTTFELE